MTAFELDSGNADEAIRGEIAHFHGKGKEFEWKVFSFDTPPDLINRLTAAGFSIGPKEAVVVYDLAAGMAPFEEPHAAQVCRIEREDPLPDFRSVAETVFCKDYSFTTNQLANAIRNGHKGHDGYVAYLGERPVSVGRLFPISNGRCPPNKPPDPPLPRLHTCRRFLALYK